jgi:hypothetical protein
MSKIKAHIIESEIYFGASAQRKQGCRRKTLNQPLILKKQKSEDRSFMKRGGLTNTLERANKTGTREGFHSNQERREEVKHGGVEKST